jgi:hypothetical protein
MPLNGDLSEVALVDVMRMLTSYSGRIEIHAPEPIGEVLLVFKSRSVIYVRQGRRSLEALPAMMLLRQLGSIHEGDFSYIPEMPRMPPVQLLNWPFSEVLGFLGSSWRLASADSLPDPEQEFVAVATMPPLEDDLFNFWEQARKLLVRGASASAIARALAIEVEMAQVYLMKLANANKIKAVDQPDGSEPPASGRS